MDDPEFSETLEQLGIEDTQQLAVPDLREGRLKKFHSLVMPLGLPRGWAGEKSEDQVEFYSYLRHLMASDSYLLLGFNNAWTAGANHRTNYYSCSPGRMTDQLKRAGFKSVQIFGAMPNLRIPEYIFDLDPGVVHFALRNRFRRKPAVLRALRLLGGTLGWARISDFLPCYFALAMA
ncbi:MAG TPA: hypothetical protein VK880_13600 [Anaerolineales bacterium]|nr:hypothetical protein [Anaerolineales bacterium]